MADEPRDQPAKPDAAPPGTGDDREGDGREWSPPEVEDLPDLEELELRR
jgi:hypothetical protein